MISKPDNKIGSLKQAQLRGHALLLTIVILLITAAVAFGVLSMGRHARIKEMTHFSAKAGAESGASWIARSLNTVAMNNQAMAKLIVDASVVNALPLALEMYINDLGTAHQLLKDLDPKTMPRLWQPIDKHNAVSDAFIKLQRQTYRELKAAKTTQKYLKEQTQKQAIKFITHVQPDDASQNAGQIWQAIETLDEVNQTILENIEIQTQLSVLRGSILDTTARQTEASALLLSTSEPSIPWQRGSFDDFKSIIFNDQNYKMNMEYFDYYESPNLSVLRRLNEILGKPRGRRGKCPVAILKASKQPLKRKSNQPPTNQPMIFNMPAAKDQAVLNLYGPLITRLHNKRLMKHQSLISQRHLQQLWPDEKAKPLQIHASQWVTDIDQIYKIIDKDPKRISEVAFINMQIRSAKAQTDPQFLRDGTWQLQNLSNEHYMQIEYFQWNKKLDPRKWVKRGMTKVHDRIWRESWTYQTRSDYAIKLKAKPATKDKKYPKHTVYRVDDYILVGVNVGKPIQLRSPYNFPANSTKPAPMLYVLDPQNKTQSQKIQRTVVAQNHDRNLPWTTPVAPTDVASATIATSDFTVNNLNNSLWFQNWQGIDVPNNKPSLTQVQPTTALEPLVSRKLYESVIAELSEMILKAKEENEVQ